MPVQGEGNKDISNPQNDAADVVNQQFRSSYFLLSGSMLTTQHNIPEDTHFHTCCCESLKSHLVCIVAIFLMFLVVKQYENKT
jgi:hypothetical protein